MVSRRVRFSVWWKRVGFGVRFVTLLFGLVAFSAFHLLARSDSGDSGTGLLVLNLLIVILCIFAFLVARNVIKLAFDRRRGIFGSKVRTRLVLSFVGITIVPILFMYVLASGLLGRVFDGWFAPQVESAVDGALAVARSQVNSLTDAAISKSNQLVKPVEGIDIVSKQELMNEKLEEIRSSSPFFSLRLVNAAFATVAESVNVAAITEAVEEPTLDESSIQSALGGKLTSNVERRGAHQFVRVYRLINFPPRKFVLVSSLLIDPDLSSALSAVSDSYRDYQQLKRVRGTVQSGYTVTLGIVGVLVLFGAVWVGFYLSRQISDPIRRLAEGMDAVAKGNLEFRLPERGKDEFMLLNRSFNSMSSDLRTSRVELEERSREIEAILSSLSVGLIRLDSQRNIVSANKSAQDLLKMNEWPEGRSLFEYFPRSMHEQLLSLFEKAEIEGRSEQVVSIDFYDSSKKMILTIGSVPSLGGKARRTVLVLDDITEITKSEREAAWREVARRVAHEIKNPLTPLQLSAQRLEKHFSNSPEAKEITGIILEHIESIRRLVTEFSHNVRLPDAELTEVSLNQILSSVVSGYASEGHRVAFQVITDPKIPSLLADSEQLRRAVANLIDNSLTALISDVEQPSPKITVKSSFISGADEVVVEVIDNGPGIPEIDRARVFDPYFTRKADGTGLGLSIVASVVADHGGTVSVEATMPRGTKFTLRLPVRRREMKRFVGGVEN